MAKWRVLAEQTSKCYLDIEAETEEEAWEIAEDTDFSEFTEDDSTWTCELERPYRVYEDSREFKAGDVIRFLPTPYVKEEFWDRTVVIKEISDVGFSFDYNGTSHFFAGSSYHDYIVHDDVK